MIKLQNNEVYQLSDTRYPMSCRSNFNIRSGHELVFSVSAPISIPFLGVDIPEAGKPGMFQEQFDYSFDFNLA
jgi:hypothetical protein